MHNFYKMSDFKTWKQVQEQGLIFDASGIEQPPEKCAWQKGRHNDVYYPCIAEDITPTWLAVLPLMLDTWARAQGTEHAKDLLSEFKRMAAAADKWNDEVKAQQAH